MKLNDLNTNASDLSDKKLKLEKYLNDLEYERARLEKQQLEFSKQQDQLRVEIKNKNESVRFTDETLNQNNNHIINFKSEINDLKRLNDRLKQDIQTIQKNQSNEFTIGLESQNKINQLEDILE